VAIRAKFRQNDGPRAKPEYNATFSIARRRLPHPRGKNGHFRNRACTSRGGQEIVLRTAIVHSRRSRYLDVLILFVDRRSTCASAAEAVA
jgi:hypothetical protein